MARELEAKLRLNDPQSAIARLTEVGARALGEVIETNIFFDTADGGLVKSDQGLRLRVAENVASGKSRATVTHKGPNQAGQFKSREETEFEVSDANAAAKLFERLGYARQRSFQKRRRSWEMGECKIEVDQVPHLGWFIEIEGPDEAAIVEVRKKLGMESEPSIKTSYIAMLEEYIRSRGLSERDIRF